MLAVLIQLGILVYFESSSKRIYLEHFGYRTTVYPDRLPTTQQLQGIFSFFLLEQFVYSYSISIKSDSKVLYTHPKRRFVDILDFINLITVTSF